MKWSDGPVACTLTDYTGSLMLGQIILADTGIWIVFDYHTGATVRLGSFPQASEAKETLEGAQ